MKRLCGLISGGKDSNYSFYHALRNGYTPVCILSLKPRRSDSWMFHVPYVSLVKFQAIAMGLQNIYHEYEVSGAKEREVEELEEILEELKVRIEFDAVSVGALASRYQYERIARIAKKLGVEVYAPQWLRDPVEYMRLLVREGFQFIITRIAVYGLPPRFLGKPLTSEDIEEIIRLSKKYGFHPAFEGGEAETFLVDAPHFKKRIIVEGEPVKQGPFEWEYKIREVKLVDKHTGD